MDASGFDSFAKRLAAPSSRRQALGATLAGGLLNALGIDRSLPEVQAAQRDSCTLAFVATVRVGPDINQNMTNGGRPGELRGNLTFSLSNSGDLQDAALLLADNTSFPVVGQATGHSLQLRVDLGDQLALVAVGVGEQEIAACSGAIDGLITGPSVGDIGDWHAAGQPGTNRTAGGGGGNAGAKKDAQAAGGSAKKKDKPVAAAAPGSAPASTKPASTKPASTNKGSACAAGQTRCGDACVDLSSDEKNCGACGSVCESGLVPVECRSGVCERANCPEGITYCGAVDGCRDLETDPEHCGACQNVCPVNNCSGGVCGGGGIQNCAPPFGVCGETCVDLRSDSDNCGACGNVCQTSPEIYSCEDGVCVEPSCDPLLKCGFLCVDASSDAFNCGACGVACAADQICVNGSCTAAAPCPAGQLRCYGLDPCIDLQTDPQHCGDCSLSCNSGMCQGGQCVEAGGGGCLQGLTDCGGTCTDLTSDNDNCGACGVVCGEGMYCDGFGSCVPAGGGGCLVGLTDCGGGICVDLNSDPANCGACGVDCAGSGGTCVGGSCVLPSACAPGLADCGGVCIDTTFDDANCGGCGIVCAANTSCQLGVCFGGFDLPL